MDIYKLIRNWFDWCFENPEKINPNHGALYFFILEHCNRMGWKSKFGLPTSMAKEAIGIRNFRTYKNTLSDLVEFGFIKMIEISKNQYSSNIVAIAEITKAPTKALDKAMQKHTSKQSQKQVQSIDSIIIHNTNIPITDLHNNNSDELIFPFESELFLNAWNILIKQPKWKKKTNHALQLNLKQLSEYSEDVAIKMIEKSIAGNYQGLFEINKTNGKKSNIDAINALKD